MAPLSKSAPQLAITLLSLACTYWQPGTPNPAEFISNKQPKQVRVTRTDGSKFQLRNPTVFGDSLLGKTESVRDDTLLSVAIPLSDVQNVEVKKISVGNTAGLVGATVLFATFTAVIIHCDNKKGFEKIDCP